MQVVRLMHTVSYDVTGEEEYEHEQERRGSPSTSIPDPAG